MKIPKGLEDVAKSMDPKILPLWCAMRALDIRFRQFAFSFDRRPGFVSIELYADDVDRLSACAGKQFDVERTWTEEIITDGAGSPRAITFKVIVHVPLAELPALAKKLEGRAEEIHRESCDEQPTPSGPK